VDDQARYGWAAAWRQFRSTPPVLIRGSLEQFIRDASAEQIRAWDESIAPLQNEVAEVMGRYAPAGDYEAIFEYELPLEHRRPDVIFLASGGVLVLEIKGKSAAVLADLDQASAYGRDLKAYHIECHHRPVHPVLVLTRQSGRLGKMGGVDVVGLDAVDELVDELERDVAPPIEPERFLAADAYSPLPTIVEAARELFESGSLRRVHLAATATAKALEEITRIIHEAAQTGTRRLVLVTGVPGAGKTLVGLQVAHARFLDDLAITRDGGRRTPPAVYLSGNGPLVEVLQYEFRSAGGGGKAFVRGVKSYVEQYTRNPRLIPGEHVLIYDEAQRAWDAARVADKHAGRGDGRSEPEHFVEFAERIPGWCVVIGLIGQGQEIHIGEEGGVGQWRSAVDASQADWSVHGPPQVESAFAGRAGFVVSPDLHLGRVIRSHLATESERFVALLLGESNGNEPLRTMGAELESRGFHLRISRDLQVAKEYLWERYRDDPEARFGLVASARDKDLAQFGIPNQSTSRFQRFEYGPWYVEGDGDYLGRSCRTLRTCVTEFGAQGLELDAALVAWGTDFVRSRGAWDTSRMKRYAQPNRIRDARQLRLNAYRVLLTRARDANVVFVPPIPLLDETYEHLRTAGFRVL
jgi:hypothetical protein